MIKRVLSYFAFLLVLALNNISADSSSGTAQSVPSGFNAGPDIVAGNMADLQQFGAVGTQRGLATGITSCNAGNQLVGYFAIPGTDHPAVAQNLYRVSGGLSNNDRFEQIGQSWVKHTFGAKQANGCNFGCQPGGDFTHLGVGCSDTYFSSQSAEQGDLGSRAWINPFTGVFPSNARNHTGHVHTAVSHMMVVESADLNQTLNPGATYYAELVYVTPDEYAWCQTHPGECNMSNNASYLQYGVSGTTNFTFSQIGSPVRFLAAINAWTGATIKTIEPESGVDGRAFLAYKVTGPVAGLYHYEYAIYDLNLDRGIQSFSVPRLLLPGAGEGIGPEQNVEFHGPPQHPGFPNDGTQGDTGYSAAEWTYTSGVASLTWSSETLAQNPNANAIRWGTLYNFRFDSTTHPVTSNATIGFFKTGAPITVEIQGPAPIGGPSPTPSPTPGEEMFFTPDNHNFGEVMVGSSSDEATFDLYYFGCGCFALPVTLEPAGTSNFSITADNCSDGSILAPGAPCEVRVKFNPQSVGPQTAQLVASGGACQACQGGAHADLSGTGLPSPTPTPCPGCTPTPTPTPTASPAQALNLSTRMLVQAGDGVAIGGFIITGTDPKEILIRGIGPSLGATGVPNPLADPVLELHGPPGFPTIVNDNAIDWCTSPLPTAPPCFPPEPPPTNGLESFIGLWLDPGAYTVILSGHDNAPVGVGLVEIYDLSQSASSKLANLSTRAFVGTGNDILIAGLILGNGSGGDRVVVRGLGPSLGAVGLSSVLANPTLELRNSNGAIVRANNDWQDDPVQAAMLTKLGLAPTNNLESGIVATLQPGAYTALVSGVNNGTGLGLVEVYDNLASEPTPSPTPGGGTPTPSPTPGG